MKIDQDLRAAIRSAEKMQPKTDTWEIREANQKKSIADFLKKFPAKAKRIRHLTATIARLATVLAKSREELCNNYGLRESGKEGFAGLQFAHCDDGRKRFEKAGGKVIKKSESWRFDAVMAELAIAEPKQLAAILKKYRINWK